MALPMDIDFEALRFVRGSEVERVKPGMQTADVRGNPNFAAAITAKVQQDRGVGGLA